MKMKQQREERVHNSKHTYCTCFLTSINVFYTHKQCDIWTKENDVQAVERHNTVQQDMQSKVELKLLLVFAYHVVM